MACLESPAAARSSRPSVRYPESARGTLYLENSWEEIFRVAKVLQSPDIRHNASRNRTRCCSAQALGAVDGLGEAHSDRIVTEGSEEQRGPRPASALRNIVPRARCTLCSKRAGGRPCREPAPRCGTAPRCRARPRSSRPAPPDDASHAAEMRTRSWGCRAKSSTWKWRCCRVPYGPIMEKDAGEHAQLVRLVAGRGAVGHRRPRGNAGVRTPQVRRYFFREQLHLRAEFRELAAPPPGAI